MNAPSEKCNDPTHNHNNIEKLKADNKKMLEEINRLKAQGGAKSGCCTIF
jgi:hypothetical protein